MKLSKASTNVLVAGVLIVGFLFVEGRFGAAPHRVSTNPGWKSDLEAAKQEAAKAGKPVLLEFGATWCGPCKEMEEEVFSTAEFQDAAKKFVLVHIDVDEQHGVADQYGVNPIPDIRFLSSKGKELHHVEGSESLPELLADMKTALEKNPA